MKEEQSMLFAVEHHAKVSPSLDCEKDWMIRVATSCSSFLRLLTQYGPDGWYGRTSPESLVPTADGTLVPSSEGWGNSATGGPTGCLTLNTSEWTGLSVPFRNVGGVCSLSDVLETKPVPQRYFLSKTACAGILRRAEKRGKDLPPQLEKALKSVAIGTAAESIPA